MTKNIELDYEKLQPALKEVLELCLKYNFEVNDMNKLNALITRLCEIEVINER